MIKYTLTVFLTIHILCDFYFQTEKMALRKQTDFRGVIYHAMIYGGAALALLEVFFPGIPGYYTISFALVHGVIDAVKYCFCRNIKRTREISGGNKWLVFLTDQMLHLLSIIIIVYCMRKLDIRGLYNPGIKSFLDTFEVSEKGMLRWLIKLLLVHKPANILIANILSFYKPADVQAQSINDKNAGRFIGTLERIIMVIFISINQYSAVGLVLTAKSIARYDKISGDKIFAEYYLLGTLLSTICAVCVALVF